MKPKNQAHRKEKRHKEALQRQEEYEMLTPLEKQAKDDAWHTKRGFALPSR